ncbi:MAG TPA: peptide chain release factor N(5)-glutamine methyltransferase [Terracidiphilus sp.]|nr:peptide chain release factor N(5)-glutamine methyltransferase [Terracidiphilus sp.]
MTLKEWLEKGEGELLAGPHPERARRDAESLLLYLMGKNRAWLLAHLQDEFAGCTAIRYAAHLRRRGAGEPLQYIIGETEFYGLPFRVTPEVLVPRPETEHLVEKVLELSAHFPAPRILDIGTGSGAIAVALAHVLPGARVTAVDLSIGALDVARDNARLNHLAERIRFLHGDLLAPVSGETFDIVVSNPPYIPLADRPSLAVEVRDFEPTESLFAGEDGLDFYRSIPPSAYALLTPGGFLALEVGYGQQAGVLALLSSAGFSCIAFTPDLQGIPRVATAQRV